MTGALEGCGLIAAADTFAWEADQLEKQSASSTEYIRGIRACVTALRERAQSAPAPPKDDQ
jgi:hypothetical protein